MTAELLGGGGVESVIMTPTAQPHIQVLYDATQSIADATVLSTVMVIMAIFGCVNMVATCSRQPYAFARDDGLPFVHSSLAFGAVGICRSTALLSHSASQSLSP